MALSSRQLAEAKGRFLRKFGLHGPGQAGWREVALRDSMTASTRRTHLFRPGVSLAGRLEVRQGWASELNEIADPYVRDADSGLSRQRFEADIMHLRAFMNFGFGSYFWEEPVRSYGPGFRVAHAQK